MRYLWRAANAILDIWVLKMKDEARKEMGDQYRALLDAGCLGDIAEA